MTYWKANNKQIILFVLEQTNPVWVHMCVYFQSFKNLPNNTDKPLWDSIEPHSFCNRNIPYWKCFLICSSSFRFENLFKLLIDWKYVCPYLRPLTLSAEVAPGLLVRLLLRDQETEKHKDHKGTKICIHFLATQSYHSNI